MTVMVMCDARVVAMHGDDCGGGVDCHDGDDGADGGANDDCRYHEPGRGFA